LEEPRRKRRGFLLRLLLGVGVKELRTDLMQFADVGAKNLKQRIHFLNGHADPQEIGFQSQPGEGFTFHPNERPLNEDVRIIRGKIGRVASSERRCTLCEASRDRFALDCEPADRFAA
jgi:hypothetical protein